MGEIDYLNQRWFDYTGLSPSESDDPTEVLHPDDFEPSAEALGTSPCGDGTAFQSELRLRRGSDGAYRWHLARAVPAA